MGAVACATCWDLAPQISCVLVHKGLKTRRGDILPDRSVIWLKEKAGIFIVRNCVSLVGSHGNESFLVVVEFLLETTRSRCRPSGMMHVVDPAMVSQCFPYARLGNDFFAPGLNFSLPSLQCEKCIV